MPVGRGSPHPPNGPTNKGPSPKFLHHTCAPCGTLVEKHCFLLCIILSTLILFPTHLCHSPSCLDLERRREADRKRKCGGEESVGCGVQCAPPSVPGIKEE